MVALLFGAMTAPVKAAWNDHADSCDAAFTIDDYDGVIKNCGLEYEDTAQDFETSTDLLDRCLDKNLMGQTATQLGWAYKHKNSNIRAARFAKIARKEFQWVLANGCASPQRELAQEYLTTSIRSMTAH